jgi:tRNA 2-selenouridine synthase
MERITDIKKLLLDRVPLMDVRSPVEFQQGAFPQAINLPLLDDEQRHQIGLCYKQQGQDAAIALGWKLATPALREQRLSAWAGFAQAHPDAALYCFRGGLRSQVTAQLLREADIQMPVVAGGYKAMRSFLLTQMEQLAQQLPKIIISGRTGSGKSELIEQMPGAVDLEGLAHHRGSSFGHRVSPQPSQIGFENALAIALLRHEQERPDQVLFLEDESRLIGRIALPHYFQAAMHVAPIWVLEAPLEERENRVLQDYIVRQRVEFEVAFGSEAAERFDSFVLDNLARIQRRLGAVRYDALRAQFVAALVKLESTGEAEAFRPGIRQLLLEYYDPMYDYQLSKRAGLVQQRGDQKTLLAASMSIHAS